MVHGPAARRRSIMDGGGRVLVLAVAVAVAVGGTGRGRGSTCTCGRQDRYYYHLLLLAMFYFLHCAPSSSPRPPPPPHHLLMAAGLLCSSASATIPASPWKNFTFPCQMATHTWAQMPRTQQAYVRLCQTHGKTMCSGAGKRNAKCVWRTKIAAPAYSIQHAIRRHTLKPAATVPFTGRYGDQRPAPAEAAR
jgi:hypothetical protein